MKLSLLVATSLWLAASAGAAEARLLPGPQADGSVLLHNQWPIRPVGSQIPLGDFPVNLVVDPSGHYAAVLHAGWAPHEIQVVDLRTRAVVSKTRIREVYDGLAFSPDGSRLYCSGGTERVLHSFAFSEGKLTDPQAIKLPSALPHGAVGGLAIAPDGRSAFIGILFTSQVIRVDLTTGATTWTTSFDPRSESGLQPEEKSAITDIAPNDNPVPPRLVNESDPFCVVFDPKHHRVYVSLWGKSDVAAMDSESGAILARWPAGLHPNEIALSRDATRLFVSNGGLNSVTVMGTENGQVSETLQSALASTDLPGSTPDSLSLSPDGDTLFIANAYNNNVAIFDVSRAGHGHALGYIPTGWFPTSVRATSDGKHLLVVSARGLEARSNPGLPPANQPQPRRLVTVKPGVGEPTDSFPYIGSLYDGSMAVVDLPKSGDRDATFRHWTDIANLCRPATPPVASPDNPIPAVRGGVSPIKYIIYIIKENRTYDEVFGDMPEGNGDSSICLFPEKVTPNLHKIARQFVLLDNFYANAEVSAAGHEWSMAAYSSEFVERNWPINYGHKAVVPYPSEGGYVAAVPALGYIWDDALRSGVSFRDYGEFVHGDGTPQDPSVSNLPALKGKVDSLYRGWNLNFSDLDRLPRFISELHRFEALGDMPHLQIVRLPNDHTQGAKAKKLTPRAMVAQNDLAVGRLVEAVSHSRFWPQAAIFIVEDDAQNGPDHVDAHRTEALVISPYTRRHAVDSTAYTTCSMLSSMELILGMAPLSQFDAAATPMRASFQTEPNVGAYDSTPNQVSMDELNPANTRAAALSAKFNFDREDAIDDQAFNRVIWAAMKGEKSTMPAPIHAAFVRSLPASDDDDDD